VHGVFNTRISLIPELAHNTILARTKYKRGTIRLERSLFHYRSKLENKGLYIMNYRP
jgi:hypothetical protein